MIILTLISSQLILATVTSAAIFFDPTAVKHSCVNDDGSTLAHGVPFHLSDLNTTLEEQTILLKPISPDTTINDGAAPGITSMCAFHRWTLPLEDKDAKRGFYLPLGRSVPSVPAEGSNNASSYGDWTRPPGRASRELDYICGTAGSSGDNFAAGEYLCEVTLPVSSMPHAKDPSVLEHNDVPYFLTYYQRSMTVRNELSRFLQKNTFGPTASELDALEAVFVALQNDGQGYTHAEAMEQLQRDWVVSQMDPSTFSTGEFSSLRAYWRRRLNPRKEETYRIGESGPHPCETHSRWRKFAFTNFDVQNSKALRWGNQDLGGAYQTQTGHRITVERKEYSAPAEGTITGSPTSSPMSIPSRRLMLVS